jgi:predicted aldo/keto reductase-like oxidoreductase
MLSAGLGLAAHPAGWEGIATPSTEMRFRTLGKSGLKVSEIAFGSYGFNNPELLSAALERGVNFICTCADYQNGRAEEAIGEAISKVPGSRNKLVIMTGTAVGSGKTKQAILATLNSSLRRLRTDRVDIFKVHDVDDPAQLKVESFFEAFAEAKKAGKVGHLGMSGHGRNLRQCLNTAIDDGRYELIQCRYDFSSYADIGEIFDRAAKKGIGAVVFKVSAGERQKEIKDLEGKGRSFRQATVKWALSRPSVSSFCAGITSFDDVKELCGAVGQQMTSADWEMLDRYAHAVEHKYCRNCGRCEPACPHGVAVADVMRFAMYFRYYHREKDSMLRYSALPAERRALPCGDCPGYCEAACPHQRRVRAGLVEAHSMLT